MDGLLMNALLVYNFGASAPMSLTLVQNPVEEL